MDLVIAGAQYFFAAFVGVVMAVLPTVLVSWAIFPPDGPVGEGLFILFIHLVACCVFVPTYIYLMTVHRRGPSGVRRRFICDTILRISVVVAGCFVSFMAVKLPTIMATKLIVCTAMTFLSAWAIIPSLWNRHASQTEISA